MSRETFGYSICTGDDLVYVGNSHKENAKFLHEILPLLFLGDHRAAHALKNSNSNTPVVRAFAEDTIDTQYGHISKIEFYRLDNDDFHDDEPYYERLCACA